MADNIVEVVITGRDDTGAAYTSAAAEEKAFADLTDKNAQKFQRNWDANRRAVLRGHDALLQAARAEMEIDREAQKLRGIEQEMSGGRGLLGRMFFGSGGGGWGSGGLSGMLSGGESSGGSILSSIGGAGGGLGWVGLAAAAVSGIGAIATELTALTSGFAAAGAGAGAFFALSHNAFTQLASDTGKLQSGQVAVQLAQNLETLYPSQKHLNALDAAKQKLNALTMSFGQDAGPAAQAMNQMANVWHNLQNAFMPTAFKVLGDAFKVIGDAMPAILPMAQAFAGALDPMLKQLDSFVTSTGFTGWLKNFTALIGPATTAIGQGVGLLAQNFGRLLTTMSAKDVVNGINIAFRILNGTLGAFIWITVHAMKSWDETSRGIVQGWHDVRQWTLDAWHAIDQVFHNIVHAWDNAKHAWDNFTHFLKVGTDDVVGFFKALPGRIISALGDLGKLLWNAGASIISGLWNGMKSSVGGFLSWVSSIGGLIASHKGPIDVDRVLLFPHGQAIMQGLMEGIGSKVPALNSQLTGITRGIAGLPGGGGLGLAGGGVLRLQIEFVGGDGPIIEAFKQAIRVRGGGGTNSVQRALGQSW